MIVGYSRTFGSLPPLTDLQIWFKTPIVGLSNDDDVTTWPDSSGNGNDGTGGDAGIAGLKPVYKTNILDGLPIVRFTTNGTTTAPFVRKDSFSVAGWTGGTAYIVVKADLDPPPGATTNGLWHLGSGDGGDVTYYPFSDNNVYDSGLSTDFKTVGNLAALTSWRLYCITSTASAWEAFLDGVSQFSTGTNTFSGPTQGGVTDLFVGLNAANFSIGGDIAEFLLYKGAHDTTARQTVEAYFADRFPTLGL